VETVKVKLKFSIRQLSIKILKTYFRNVTSSHHKILAQVMKVMNVCNCDAVN
jgi:hypothetical protein